jgi:hypothetical protein
MSAHTPGPWTWGRLVDDTGEPLRGEPLEAYVLGTIERSGGADFFAVLCEKPDGPADVCHTGNGPTSAENARLIAAAPDLLEAARVMLEAPNDDSDCCTVCGEDAAHDSLPHEPGCPIPMFRAAIAKAEGR